MNWNSVRAALTTPTEVPRQGPRLQTNLDTDLLKLVAIVSMLIDHVGGAFFPEVGAFRWIGRLAFPIFCYCLTVGLLYTRNIKRYLGRLAVFAVVSQPFYVLAFHPHDWMVDRNWSNWNIFFTLFLSLLAMYGFKERKWWLFLGAFLIPGKKSGKMAKLLRVPTALPEDQNSIPYTHIWQVTTTWDPSSRGI